MDLIRPMTAAIQVTNIVDPRPLWSEIIHICVSAKNPSFRPNSWTKTLIWPISTTSTPPNIYIVGKLWIMAICWPYPFTLPKFLQDLRILLTPPESYYGMILDCDFLTSLPTPLGYTLWLPQKMTKIVMQFRDVFWTNIKVGFSKGGPRGMRR